MTYHIEDADFDLVRLAVDLDGQEADLFIECVQETDLHKKIDMVDQLQVMVRSRWLLWARLGHPSWKSGLAKARQQYALMQDEYRKMLEGRAQWGAHRMMQNHAERAWMDAYRGCYLRMTNKVGV